MATTEITLRERQRQLVMQIVANTLAPVFEALDAGEITAQALSDASGVSTGHISQLRSGQTGARDQTMQKLLAGFAQLRAQTGAAK